MRLTRKLVLAITLAILAVLGANAVYRLGREISLFEEDIQRDTRQLGRAVAGAAARVWRQVGKSEALDLVADANERENNVVIRWVWLDEPMDGHIPAMPLDELRTHRGREIVFRLAADGDTVDDVYVYVPADVPDPRRGGVELRASLTTERTYIRKSIVHAVVTTTILALICGLVATVLGIVLVGRPVRKLVEQARRIGNGDLSGRLVLRQRDEIGDLGAEMNAMSARLLEARTLVEAETTARVAMLDQLRHADRLTTVGKLAAGVAHELGTPLNVITGHAQLLLDAPGESVRENATVIAQQARRVADTVRQLLDFARVRKPMKERIELSAVCRQVAALLEPLARKRSVDIRLELRVVEVEADAGQLQQVLTNLVVNAIQATTGGGAVTVGLEHSTLPDAASPRHARMWVRDTGSGMAPDVAGRVFEPFFTTKDIGDGTGLGLSVVYGIIAEHGGWIDVDTMIGRGSTFSIFLPEVG